MMNFLLAISIFNVISLSIQNECIVIKWDTFIVDENYIQIDSATVMDGNKFSIKLQTIKPLDFVEVSNFSDNIVMKMAKTFFLIDRYERMPS